MENVVTVEQSQVETEKKKRFIALDVVRGLTMALMILANNPGSWSHMWPFMEHASWIGFTLADAIFPSFMTCMGFAMVFSMKHVVKFDLTFLRKVVVRGLLLILVGYVISTLSGTFSRMSDGKNFIDAINETFYKFRFYGVFPRLGITFLVSGTILVLTKKNIKWLIGISGTILIGYMFLLGFGHGYEFSADNIVHIVDSAIFPPNHLYGQVIDPEGLLSTIPCMGQVLMAYVIGKIFIDYKDRKKALLGLFATAGLLVVTGIFISSFCPISKKVWTTSFVLISSGVAFGLISIVAFFENMKHSEKVFYVWKVIGANSLTMYIFSSLLGIALNNIKINADSIHNWIYKGFSAMCANNLAAASFVYGMMILIITWLLGLLLYKKKIFIKL